MALYHALLKALLHKTNEYHLTRAKKKVLEFESENYIHCVKLITYKKYYYVCSTEEN